MSTSFNFPANPALWQTVPLPDGSYAQWNGYTWASLDDDTVVYPLVIGLGGSAADNAPQALVNFGGSPVGIGVFTAADQAAARAVLGVTDPTNGGSVGNVSEVLYNKAGAMGASSTLRFDDATRTLTVGVANSAVVRVGGDTGVMLAAPAINALEQRNAAFAQSWRLYETYTDASNYSRLALHGGGTMKTEAGGTGVAKGIIVQAGGTGILQLGAGGANWWRIPAAGGFQPETDNVSDVGAAGVRARSVYAGTSVQSAGSVNAGYSSGITTAGYVSSYSGVSPKAQLTPTGLLLAVDGIIGWGSTANAGSNLAVLAADTTGILAQRNGVIAQSHRFYNTYTDSSNYERASLWWSGNVLNFVTEAGGTGTQRTMVIGAGSSIRLDTVGTGRFSFSVTGMLPITTDLYDIGATSLRIKKGYFKDLDLGGAFTVTGTTSLMNPTIAGAGSVAANSVAGGLFFTGPGIRHANIGFMPNEREFLFNGGGDALSVTDTYGINIAMRGGIAGNAQLRIYNTGGYVDASNYERLETGFTSNVATLLAKSLGTGTGRNMSIGTTGDNSIYFQQNGGTKWHFSNASQANSFAPFASDNTYDIGISSSRPRIVYAGTSVNAPVFMVNGATMTGIAHLIEQRAGLTAQRHAVYNTYTDASNYERAIFGYQSSELQIGHEGLGTGVLTRVMGLRASTIYFRNPNASNFNGALLDLTNKRWDFYNTNDGGSNFERFATIWTGNILQLSTQAGGTGVVRNMRIQPSTAGLLYLGADASDRWQINATGMVPMLTNSYDIGQSTLRVNTLHMGTGGISMGIAAGGVLNGTTGGYVDFRNGVTAQSFAVYRTYTDASNYERMTFRWNSTVWEETVDALGTGVTTNPMRIGTNGTGALYLRAGGTDRYHLQSTGHFCAVVDNTYDIGNSAAFRPRSLYLGTDAVIGGSITAVVNVIGSGQVRAPSVRTTTLTFATLPAAAANEGARAFISDGSLPATAANYGAAAAGGGANKVPVWSNGAAWFIG